MYHAFFDLKSKQGDWHSLNDHSYPCFSGIFRISGYSPLECIKTSLVLVDKRGYLHGTSNYKGLRKQEYFTVFGQKLC